MMEEQIMPDGEGRLDSRHGGWLRVIGRLKSDISMQQASARIDQVAEHLVEIDPERYKDETAFITQPSGIGLPPEARPMVLGLSVVIMSMVGMVLLVACANVANLLLARSTARRSEIALRLALGAGRTRIVRQLLTESGLLALLAGAAGLLLAVWGTSLAKALIPELPYNMSLATDFSLDGRVFAYAVAISMLTGLVFGLAPALQVTKANVVDALKDDVGARGTGARRSRLRGALVVAQVAVSLILLISAGLFIRSLSTAHAIDPGFDHENVLAVSLAFALHDDGSETEDLFYAPLLKRVRAIPGVESASIDQCIPLGFTQSGNDYWIEGRPPRLDADGEEDPDSSFQSIVSEGGFETLGISLLRGRDFNEFDARDGPGVVIVNQALADRNWPGESALGRQISIESAEGPFLEIVGVASTVKYIFIGEQPRPFLYLPFSQNYDPNMNLLVRASGDPMALLPAVRSVIRDLNPDVSPADTRILSGWIGFALLPAKLAAMLFGLFGVVAVLIASVGLYGVMSYTAGQRTREIGIRVALGAQRGDVLRLILRQGLVLTVVGLGLGLMASFGGTRVLSALLYDVSVTDPIAFVGVSVLLLTVASLACYVPARRATRVDPIVALRYE
jgi:predicted permease